jgi:hypothetical protein
VPQTASVAHVRRILKEYACLHVEVRAKPETERAPFAALPFAVLFLAQTILHAFMPVVTIVERRPCGTRPFHRRVSQKFPRNRAFASPKPPCDFIQRIVSREHPLDALPFAERKMFVI